MKIKIALTDDPGLAFADVARIMAKGDPPDWLPQALAQFSEGIGVGSADEYGSLIKQMADATDVLLRWLPAFQHLPFGMKTPADVATLLETLPRLKKELDRHIQPKTGRPPYVQRKICAAVIVEAWKLLHGKVEPRSSSLEQACADYWKVCGGEKIGED